MGTKYQTPLDRSLLGDLGVAVAKRPLDIDTLDFPAPRTRTERLTDFLNGFMACLLVLMMGVLIGAYMRQQDEYASSPSDIIRKWAKPAYEAGAKDGNAKDFDVWFKAAIDRANGR